MSSTASQLRLVQVVLTRYGMTAYLAFGNLGLLANLIVFTRSAHRRNPSSLYILSMTICGFLGLNVGIIPVVYALDHADLTSSSMVTCKLQYYLRHLFNQLMRMFVILACADRYAICSQRTSIRSFSQYKIAIRVTVGMVLVWASVAIFPTTLQTIVHGRCGVFDVLHSLLFIIYIMLVVNLLPLFGMATFGLLIFVSLKRTRGRVHNVHGMSNGLRKRDRDMMKMLLIELMGFILTTIPGTFVLLFVTLTKGTAKSVERQQIESFLSFITRGFSVYLNNGLSFWIYLTVSQTFRSECQNLLKRCLTTITCQSTKINDYH